MRCLRGTATHMSGMLRKAAITAAATGSTFLGLTIFKLYDLKQHAVMARCSSNGKPSAYLEKLPTRQEHLKSLQETPEYDVLIMGGGATGTLEIFGAVILQSLLTQTWLRQPTMASTWSVHFFKTSEKQKFCMHFTPWIPFSFKTLPRLCFCKGLSETD